MPRGQRKYSEYGISKSAILGWLKKANPLNIETEVQRL